MIENEGGIGARAMMDVGVSDGRGRGCIIMSLIAVTSTILWESRNALAFSLNYPKCPFHRHSLAVIRDGEGKPNGTGRNGGEWSTVNEISDGYGWVHLTGWAPPGPNNWKLGSPGYPNGPNPAVSFLLSHRFLFFSLTTFLSVFFFSLSRNTLTLTLPKNDGWNILLV